MYLQPTSVIKVKVPKIYPESQNMNQEVTNTFRSQGLMDKQHASERLKQLVLRLTVFG